MFTVERFQTVLQQIANQHRFIIALSGGLDSIVLLHAMVQWRHFNSLLQLRAVHVNHGFSTNADDWQRQCHAICQQLNVEYIGRKIQVVHKPGESLEEEARQLRYQIFAELLQENECLLTAHTQNDQAETLLLQLLRGAGPKGLSAMPVKKRLANGFLLRPLLNFTRQELTQYARAYQLAWIEDESNFNLRFDRNYLRHQIIPLLQARWPGLLGNFSRSAAHCMETVLLLNELAMMDFIELQTSDEWVLNIEPLLLLSHARQRNVLRYWFQQLNITPPNTKKMYQLQKDLLLSSKDTTPCLRWDDVEMRRYRNRLYVLSQYDCGNTPVEIRWNLQEPIILPNKLGRLVVEKTQGSGITPTINCSSITIRFRQGGEKCRPLGRKHTHVLKKLFQEWGVPPWQRNQVPLIYCGDELVAVVGYCVCEKYAVGINELGWQIKRVER